MQLFFAVLCLGIIGTSAQGKCDSHCEHKGKCFTEMAKKSLSCNSGTQPRPECDHHDPFGGKTPSSDEIKKQCCQVTCYSLFTAKKFTCLAGHEPPTKKDFRHMSADRKPEDLQRECCKKPKVSCYTLFKADKFTCPDAHFKPTATYLNDDIHEDMSKKTKTELQSRCCRKKSICYSKLTKKSLDCDGFGTMPERDDSSRDGKLTAEAEAKDSILQKQCCRPNCVAVMKEKSASCSGDTIMRTDGHTPTDTSAKGLQKECCVQNCYTKMKKEKLTCAKGSVLKDKSDMHNPGDAKGDALKGQCCERVTCSNNYCFSAMTEKGIWGTCPELSKSPDKCDGHYPFGHRDGESDEDRMKFIKAKSAAEIKKGCCRMACYGMMKSKGLKCPAGYKGRDKSDGHSPFGSDVDWTKKPDSEITGSCCRKVNRCYSKLRGNNLGCKGYGVMVDEYDEWKADVDPSKLKTEDEIQTACCRKTCSIAMTKKKLECDDGEKLRCSEWHRPHRWKSFDQPDADLKWGCCEAGPKRPKFSGCEALLKCSGDACHSKCPRDERARRGGDDPFHGSRDFTKMKEAELQKYCCKPTCYDQVKSRKLTCGVATKIYDKSDEHNPFGWDKDMRTRSNKEILDKCCKPLNKCYTKLKQMGLGCDGIGSFPGETDDTKYDFDPLKLTKAEDVKSKCCKPNCFYSIKKRGLKCKIGLPRSQHDGHNPFGAAGFAKQSDDKILEQCCSENCYSYLTAKKLTCDAGEELRGKDDFHHVDFKGLKKPEDAKAQCCRVACADIFKDKKLTCDAGYRIKDDKETAEEWKGYSTEKIKGRCCEKLSEECKKGIAEAKKDTKWVDKRPEDPAALVAYLNDWGDRVLRTKTVKVKYHVVSCRSKNKKFKTAEACKAADESCCFSCDKMDCGGDLPIVSTCKGDEPSAFMKKFDAKKCSTPDSIDLSPMSDECGTCPSPRDLFKQYDDGTLFSDSIDSKVRGIGATRNGFHGGINLHNVRSEVRVDDKSCPNATAGLLISPRNSGAFTMTGKAGTVFAIVGVVNEKSTDPTKGVKLGGAADFLIIGGSNEGEVDVTTTGKVSVVGMDNKGKVNAKGADNILVGNTVNSGKVILETSKTGAIVNVANKVTAEVVVKGGTWKLHDVSNAKGGKVTIDAAVVEFGGPRTRNDGSVEIKSGKITSKVTENTGVITIADGVTGTLLLCKNSGKITNNGKMTVSVKPADPFCKKPTVTAKPATKPSLATKLFYCREAAKFSDKTRVVDDKPKKCSESLADIKEYWEAVKYELDSPNIKRFFKDCCSAKRIPPKGKKYMLKQKKIKRKRVRAKTTVSLDFTDSKNAEKRKKFENAYIKRAKAKSTSKFAYKKKARRDRRHLKAGTEVTATLEYEDDAAAEAGKTAVGATGFSTELAKELKTEGVDTTVTDTTASIETAEETVVEEVLVDDEPDTTTTTEPDTTKSSGTTKAKKGEGAAPVEGDATTSSFHLSAAPSVLTKPVVAVTIMLITICGLI